MNNSLLENSLSFERALSFSCDNTNTMVGHIMGVYGRIIATCPHVKKSGCLCHLIHLCGKKASSKLPIQVSDLLIDIFYHFKHSDSNKKELKQFQELHDTDIEEITKHCATRWLGLGPKLGTLLNQWEPLRSYFKHEIAAPPSSKNKKKVAPDAVEFDEDAAKIARKSKKLKFIDESLSDRLSRMCVIFLNFVIPKFELFNELFQCSEPKVHVARRDIMAFMRKLQLSFVKPALLHQDSGNTPFTLDFNKTSNQVPDEQLSIGEDLRMFIIERAVSSKTQKKLYDAIREFYVTACNYIKKTFPIDDPVLVHAKVADTTTRQETSFSNVRFFCGRYPFMLPCSMDDLEDEYRSYLVDSFDKHILTNTILTKENPTKPYCERQDQRWVAISKLTDPSGRKKYQYLSYVMICILSIPISQAAAERMFSVIRKNFNENRCGMGTKTLESLLTLKHDTPCYDMQWTDAELKSMKESASAASN